MADRQNFDAKKENVAPLAQPDSRRRRGAAAVVDAMPRNVDDKLFVVLRAAALNPDPQIC